jgi:uncharacterized membrane protein
MLDKKYDKLAFGLLASILTTMVGYALVLLFFETINDLLMGGDAHEKGYFKEAFRKRTSLVLALSLNIITLNVFKKNLQHQAVRGIILGTFLGIFLWLILYWKYFFGS